MSHQIQYVDYHCSTSEKAILKDLNRWAFDPKESMAYHGNMKFHRNIICKNREEARERLEKMCNGFYEDHAIFYKEGRKKYWLCHVEFHC